MLTAAAECGVSVVCIVIVF